MNDLKTRASTQTHRNAQPDTQQNANSYFVLDFLRAIKRMKITRIACEPFGFHIHFFFSKWSMMKFELWCPSILNIFSGKLFKWNQVNCCFNLILEIYRTMCNIERISYCFVFYVRNGSPYQMITNFLFHEDTQSVCFHLVFHGRKMTQKKEKLG